MWGAECSECEWKNRGAFRWMARDAVDHEGETGHRVDVFSEAAEGGSYGGARWVAGVPGVPAKGGAVRGTPGE